MHFHGKIGMWPFVEQGVAQSASRNRERGAPARDENTELQQGDVPKVYDLKSDPINKNEVARPSYEQDSGDSA
jgi:hypothetical protein